MNRDVQRITVVALLLLGLAPLAALEAAPRAAALVPASRAAAKSTQPGARALTTVPAGIQWFTRLKDGLAEAKRTGRPILYLSAAPICGGRARHVVTG